MGIKAVNALSTSFVITSHRDGKMKRIVYAQGDIVEETGIIDTDEPDGTLVQFTPDNTVFRDYKYRDEYVIPLVKNYTFLNTGLAIIFNGKRYISRHGLLDLLQDVMTTTSISHHPFER